MFMTIRAFVFALLIIVASSSQASAFGGDKACGGETGCEQNCAQCHTLSRDEATTLLKAESALDATVVDVRQGPIGGIWEVDLQQRGQSFLIYVDYGKKYFFQVYENKFVPIAEIGKLRKVDFSRIPLEGAIVMGNKDAKHKVVVFDDPECGYCRKFHEVAKGVIEKRDDIAFFIKMYPLVQIHPSAYGKSMSIVCGDDPLSLLDDVFAGKELPPADESCTSTEVDDNIALGREFEINGTPAIIFEDGSVLPGFVEGDRLIELIEDPDK